MAILTSSSTSCNRSTTIDQNEIEFDCTPSIGEEVSYINRFQLFPKNSAMEKRKAIRYKSQHQDDIVANRPDKTYNESKGWSGNITHTCIHCKNIALE